MNQSQKYENLLKRVSENIKKARKKRGLTQEGMTEFGFNYRHYQKIESGKYSMNLYTLHRLAQHFEVSIETFFQ